MAVNPCQTVAEMSWGDYKTKKSGSITSRTPQVSTNLSGQGHRSTGSTQAAPVGSLYEPRAGGSMPQGNADIKRPNYGQQQSQEPQRQSRPRRFLGHLVRTMRAGNPSREKPLRKVQQARL